MYLPTAVKSELAFSETIVQGAGGMRARRVQEWLTFHGFATAIDADFGAATKEAVKQFQAARGMTANGSVNQATWDALTAPLVKVCSAAVPAGASRDNAILRVAKAHLAVHPIELGGDNRGPWVRAYCGADGIDYKWCAGFVSFVMSQACKLINTPLPIAGSISCDSLAAHAKSKGCFIRGKAVEDGSTPWSSLGQCQIFLVRRSPTDWTHTGFAFDGQTNTFSTIEGNTDNGGSSNGFEVAKRIRSIDKKDFISLI